MLAIDHNVMVTALALTAISAAIFGFAAAEPEQVDKLVQINRLLPVHALIGFLAGIFLIQIDRAGDADTTAGFAVAATVALAGIVAAVVLAGRGQRRGLRWIAYTGFAIELCAIYADSSRTCSARPGFFLAAGIPVAVLAFAIIRIEKRMNVPAPAEGAAA